MSGEAFVCTCKPDDADPGCAYCMGTCYVLATDYAVLSEKLSDCEIALGGETAQREHYTSYTVIHDGVLLYCSSGMRDAYAAMQAKLDAVTKDAERYRAGLAEAYEWLFESMSDGPRVSEGAIEKDYYTPEFKALHARMSAALTDQGRAGEGR